jgi:uncharacterized protein YndB with AHSA1/START domain
MSERSVEHATIVIERRYPASPERTFAALGRCRGQGALIRRLRGRARTRLPRRRGERHRGTLPDGHIYTYQAVYQDIVRRRRILYTYEMYHMLRALEEQGRIGVTAIGDSPEQAHEIYLGAAALLDRLTAKNPSPS